MSWPDPRYQVFDVTAHQRGELIKAFQGKTAILTGCPGSGKTRTLARVLRSILFREEQSPIAVCAYTGKAAVRATESMVDNGLNIRATTIHRLLVPQMNNSGTFSFLYNQHHKLPIKYLVVDEVSMLGMSTANHLFRAIPNDCFVLFIGDHHQLPPVEKGAILRDMIAGGCPHGDLKEIFRNSGQIVACCKEIREGRLFVPSVNATYGGTADQNLRHVETSNNTESLNKMLGVIDSIRQNPEIDLAWSVQVLAFVNEGSELSRTELNTRLQASINSNGLSVVDKYRLQDKVICLKNRLYEWQDEYGSKSEFVANGQMGQVVSCEGNGVVVQLKNSAEDVGTYVRVPKQLLLDEWDLGYAISIHKSQGSSWPIVLCMIDHSPRARYMASRQLVYTALSRAEKYCITIGQRRDINEACQRDAIRTRITGLADLLKEDSHAAGSVRT